MKAAASACQVNITVLTLLVMTAVNTFKNHSNLSPAYNHNWKSQFIFSTHLGNLFRSIVKKLDLENAPIRLHIRFKEIQGCHLLKKKKKPFLEDSMVSLAWCALLSRLVPSTLSSLEDKKLKIFPKINYLSH